MRILVFGLALLSFLWSTAISQTAAEMKAAGDAERAATAAYHSKAYSEFLRQMEIADDNRPNHPRLIYNLAVAFALNGRTDDALRSLGRLTKMGLAYEFEKVDDFSSLRENDAFRKVVGASAANRQPLNASARVLELRDKTMIAESVAFDTKSKQHFVGSIQKRKIVSVDSNGTENDLSSPSDGLFAVLGMKVDTRRGVLWVASSAVPQMSGFSADDKGKSGVFKYDLRTRKLLLKYLLPEGEQHMLGDLWIDTHGNVFATDSVSPNIYRIDSVKDQIELFITSDVFASLQGITRGSNKNEIFVADYAKGFFRIDLTTKAITQLKPDANVTLLGTDGLYFYDGRLIAIQNGLMPNRVAAFTISGDRVTNTTVLEANHADFLEPTLGYIHGDDLVYVANSQWPLVNEKAELQTEKLRNPVILRLNLKKALAK
jgi:sugar lactone lactonase YvrE